jgi:hypothetical protein
MDYNGMVYDGMDQNQMRSPGVAMPISCCLGKKKMLLYHRSGRQRNVIVSHEIEMR